MSSCIRKTSRFLHVVKALISRGLFVLHSLICIWRVVVIKGDHLYWTLCSTFPFMVLESVYTLCKKRNGEWKWICPSVVLYLATAVPAIWFLELDVLNQRMLAASLARREAQAAAAAAAASESPGPGHHQDGGGSARNHSLGTSDREFIIQATGIVLPMQLGQAEWCKVLEQMLLLLLIIGRWLLPKGEITREQLSQLLLVYIGMAADIIELFEAFKEEKVSHNPHLVIVILALWTASLTQFTLVVTATKSKKTRPALLRSGSSVSEAPSCGGKDCCPTEVVSIFISVLLQDAPFLVLRLMLIFRYDVLSYTNIFFTSKNTLVLVLQIYRLVVLFTESRQPQASFTQSTEVLSSCPSSSRSPSLLYHTGPVYDSCLSLDQSSLSDGGHMKKRTLHKGSSRDRNYRSPGQRQKTRSAQYSQEGETKTKPSKHKDKDRDRPVVRPTRSRDKSSIPKPQSRKLPNASPGRKSKQSERSLAARQEAEVKSPGRQAKKSGQAAVSAHSGTPRSGRKSERRDGQTISDASPGNRHGSLKANAKRIERQSKVISPTTPPTDQSDEDKMTERSGQRPVTKTRHHRLRRETREDSNSATQQEEEERDDDGEIDTADHAGVDHDTFDIDEHIADIDGHEGDIELSAAGRWDGERKRKTDQWCSVRDLKTALTLLSETDGYKTVVLKSGRDGREMMILDED